MNGIKMISNEQSLSSVLSERLSGVKTDGVSQERAEQIAKDFESLLLDKLLDAMKNTIGNWGTEKDAASSQIQGIFSMYLSQHVANNGGVGLWKEIYQQTFADTQLTEPAENILDESL